MTAATTMGTAAGGRGGPPRPPAGRAGTAPAAICCCGCCFLDFLQVIIVVVMSYERICSTARTVAAAAGVVYVTHTLVQYQVLIDHITHATYIDTVLVGVPHAHVDPFGEDLAEAADDLQCSFDGFIAHNHYNNVCYQHHKCCPARKD